jgi:hypothetical protein
MTDIEAQILGDLKVLKSQMETLVGNGQPGRLSNLEGRMQATESMLQRLKGIAATFAGLLTLAHFAIDFLVGRH